MRPVSHGIRNLLRTLTSRSRNPRIRMIRPLLAVLLLTGGILASPVKDYYLHSFRKIMLSDQFFAEGATFGDLNRDGHTDVVAGPFWYAGPDFRTRHEYYPAKPFDPEKYSDNFFAHVYDFNRDGWSDILIIGFPGEDASWYENPRGKGGLWKHHVVLEGVGNESPAWKDVTGDGRPEIVCVRDGYYGYAEVDWAAPTRVWTFHRISPKGPWQKFTHGLGVGDVNGDGRPDILEKDGWWEQPASLEGGPVWTKHAVDFGKGGAQMYAYDLDGDGNNDVITSLQAHEYGLAWFEQVRTNGRVDFVRHVIMNETPAENRYGVTFSQLHAIDLVDMDRDGIKDIVTGKRYWAHGSHGDPEPNAPAVLYWFKTVRLDSKKGVDFLPYLIDDNSGVGVHVVAGDINGDGFPDVVSSNKKGTAVLLHERRSVDKKTWQAAQPRLYTTVSDRWQ